MENLGPCQRIVRQVLNRYLRSDSNFHAAEDMESRIPRFLLNDVVRYWRTMCVDFAYKDWEQGGRKWALRNIKLRTSRKMLFVAGLLLVFGCFRNTELQRGESETSDYLLKLQAHLLKFVDAAPLDIVVWSLCNIGLESACADLIDIYKQFLVMIDDADLRQCLADLNAGQVYENEEFLRCREISHELHGVLKRICFLEDSALREFAFEYGVF